ncbi:Aste57867_2311 [Aphanomyces stellatus]|uniref:Ubiquitin-like modifier-activating enzyme ATG7 n=1 Tax=Aphanomyces stellatus TaxID=120398 RepID=A0A485KCG8_9STRA|nr:hypothetical protein As57867_002306 [Aphanomyces stellatus]VFT79513.1 Aste57867_2311 [Aphanomyces stellatus]
MSSSHTTLLQFQPFSSSPHVSFFQKLAQLKLDKYQLSDASQDITGFFELNTHADVPPRLLVDEASFGFDPASSPNRAKHEWRVPGILVNTNTLEDFKNLDKVKLLDDAKQRIHDAITTSTVPGLQTFVLCTFADLKSHTYWYRFAFPALVPTESYKLADASWIPLTSQFAPAQQISLCNQLIGMRATDESNATTQSNFPAAFLVDMSSSTDGPTIVHPLHKIADLDPASIVFGFVDPCALPTHPGWPLRNFLNWIAHHCPSLTRAQVLVYRDAVHHVDAVDASFLCKHSYLATVELTPFDVATIKIMGWELNVQGKMGPRQMQLANLLDPLQLAKTSVDLNLKLMRWRQLPQLDLDKIGNTKCLLLGAGTLGCHFARNLLAWGFRSLTLVDYGKVSHSNPVRQPLYEYSNVGEWKAPAAAKALKRIYPLVECEGHVLSIPMAGHALSNAQALQETKKAYETLEQMIASHDVIFLGTDTRESRWLPTVLAAAHEKLVINAALGTMNFYVVGADKTVVFDVGFDTYLVMRHGLPNLVDLGCYFCNDIVSPSDSLTDRTLDQMCTVTRPGGAAIAGATAVELLVCLLHNAQGKAAPVTAESHEMSVAPHQIRGFLNSFSQVSEHSVTMLSSEAPKPACSSSVLSAYREHGWDMFVNVCNSKTYLQDLTGLADLAKKAENLSFDDDSDDDESLL